jgi:hypothetical protein
MNDDKRLQANRLQASLDLQEALNKILVKESFELNKMEIAFLKARESYLTKEQLEKFAPVLNKKKE